MNVVRTAVNRAAHRSRRSKRASGIGRGRTVVSGLLAGLVAAGVKSLCEAISPPRPPGVGSPLGHALDAVAPDGRGMSDATKAVAEPAVHFLFGALAGGTYAALGRAAPVLRTGQGAPFGFAFWLLLHEVALPWMGLSPSPATMTAREQVNELGSHLVFGVVLESVHRTLLGTAP